MTESVTRAEEHQLLLRSLMPRFFWFRDRHAFEGGSLSVWGSVAHASDVAARDIIAFVNGEPVDWEGPLPNDYAASTFWFLPAEQRYGVLIEVPVAPGTTDVLVTLCTRDTAPERYPDFSFKVFLDWQEREPTPPLEKIERVSGRGATAYNYHNNGATDLLRLAHIARRHGRRLRGRTRVLDWGCGCGRLTRYLLGATPVVGVDIDHDNIDWCRAHLETAAFDVVPLFPPTALPEASFDVVLGDSVLSHLRVDALHAWLAEVRRLLRPGGLALLSYHGDFSLCGFLSRSADLVADIRSVGYDDRQRAPELDDVIGDPSYYRQMFMTDASAAEIFGRYFSVEEQVVGVVSRFQNVAVLRSE